MEKELSFNASISKLVKDRTSVRTYDENKKISEETIKKLEEYIDKLSGPFKPKVRFKVIKSTENIKGNKLGTYGVIKGAENYIGVVVEKGHMGLENLGYQMEELILYATSLGLGTCWLGGTFSKSSFAKAMDVKVNEIFTIVSPIGYKSEEIRFVDKLFRRGEGDRRKDWEDIFYRKDFYTPLDKDDVQEEIAEAFENLRLAPSALNKQPWRVVVDGEKVHFFKVGKESQAKKDNHIDLSEVDLGIAIAHFDLTCKEKGIQGQFIREILKVDGVPKNVEYLITWIRN